MNFLMILAGVGGGVMVLSGPWSDNGLFSIVAFLGLSLFAGHVMVNQEGEKGKAIILFAALGALIGSIGFIIGFTDKGLASTRKSDQVYWLWSFGIASYYYWFRVFNLGKFFSGKKEEVATDEWGVPIKAEKAPEVDEAPNRFAGKTASERRRSHVSSVGKDEDPEKNKTFMDKVFDTLTDADKKPKADIEIDMTDYLSDPESVGHLPEKLNKPDGVFSGSLLDENLRISTEDRAVIIGPPGTGKTAFLVSQLLHWAETKRSFVCLDIKPEIWGITREALERQGYKVLAFNPTAPGTLRYNPLDDLDSPEAIGELVANTITGTNEENAVFYETGRDLLDCMIGYLQSKNGRATLPQVRTLLGEFDSSEALMDELRRSDDEMVVELANELKMVGENERLFASVVASLRAGLRFLRYPSIRNALGESDFSLDDLCGDQPVALFLQFEEGKAEMLQRLTAMIVGHIMRYLIDHTDRPPVLMMLDEIGNAKGISGLTSKLNTIRSRQLPTWMYWQSASQMSLYSDGKAEGRDLIFGACDFVGVFRLNDNDTAKYISEKIGTVHRVITQNQEGFSRSTSNSEGGSSGGGSEDNAGPGSSISNGHSKGLNHQRTKQLQEEAVIKPHELQELVDGQMVCMYRGDSWKGEATPYYREWPEYHGVKPSVVRPQTLDEEYPEPVATVEDELPTVEMVKDNGQEVNLDDLFKKQ